ncbi:YdcF family protein [Peribacillus alkalitolerans]|uniref:YdcF family protein n=1 Tax=Peribacillus alkalitolerans TaxID=1550385 RepID=UPI0013D0774A|nr:YdcF family protein [Peribacillus alkalitolerans]
MEYKKKIMISIGAFTVLMVVYFCILHFKIMEHADIEAEETAEFLIVLGARVKGTVPSLSLQYRIEKAAEYLLENPHVIVIASGGQGPGEEISEAEAIKRGLIEQGVEDHRIIKEDKSTNTVENIKFSKELIPDHLEKGMIVTNDFHLFRSKMIAQDLNIPLDGLSAKTPLVAIPKSYSREYLAITKYFLYKYIL